MPGARVSAFERSKVMRKAADLLRERADAIRAVADHGAGQAAGRRAKGEVLAGADLFDWFAEEARRTYGRVIPAPGEAGVYQSHDQGTRSARWRRSRPGISRSTRSFENCRGAGNRVLNHRERHRKKRRPRRPGNPLLCRCRRPGRRDEPGLWRVSRNLRISVPREVIRKDVVHHLHHRWANSLPRSLSAHKQRHHGTQRPRAGDRVRRCRCRYRQSGCWPGAKFRSASQVCVSTDARAGAASRSMTTTPFRRRLRSCTAER